MRLRKTKDQRKQQDTRHVLCAFAPSVSGKSLWAGFPSLQADPQNLVMGEFSCSTPPFSSRSYKLNARATNHTISVSHHRQDTGRLDFTIIFVSYRTSLESKGESLLRRLDDTLPAAAFDSPPPIAP